MKLFGKAPSRLAAPASMAALLAAVLAGCSLAPVYERAPLPVSAAWPENLLPAVEHATPASIPGWQEFFTNPRLRKVIRLALENNRDLRVAALNIEQARALHGAAAADRLPNASLNAAATSQRTPASLSPSGEAVATHAYFAGAGMTSFELDFFGRVKSLNEAAYERYVASEEAWRSAGIVLIAEVAKTFETLAADQRLLALSRQTLESRIDSHTRQQQLLAQGASSEYELRQSETLLEAARASVAQQTRQVALDINALELLVGQRLDPILLPAGTESEDAQDAATRLPVGLPSDLLANRPDIRQSEAVLRAENANIGAARAAFFPRISLTGQLGSASDALSGLFASGSKSWTFLPQIGLPIFDAGRNRANLEAAQARRSIALAQYDKAIQVAFREVADALAGQGTLTQELNATRAQQQAEAARFALARQRYESGYASYLELLDAQRSLFAIEQKTIAVALSELTNRITLYKVMGGWTAQELQAAH